MSRHALLILLFAVAPAVTQNQYNEVMRFAARDLVQTATNSSTGYSLEVPGAQPAAYMATSTTGVAAGTLTWVWYPSQLNSRLADRFVTGHMVAVRPSSATPLSDYSKTHSPQTSPGVPVYIPKFSIYPAKQRSGTATSPFGVGYDPDFSKSPLLTYNTVHTPLVQAAQADQAVIWTVTYNTKVKVASREVVLAFEWQGGEHASKARSQSLPTSWSESMFSPAHWGWAAPAPGRTITHFDASKILPGQSLTLYTSPMAGYFEDEPTVALQSDWGESRETALAGLLHPSYNPGSGLADVASKAGEFAFDVFTTAGHSGKRAMPILNLKTSVHGTATNFLGASFDLDLGDPALSLFWGDSRADGLVSSYGTFLPSKRIQVPALGAAALGTWVGVEYGIVDLGTGAVLGTTPGLWFYIQK